jgi:hypothetical protein
MPYHARTNPRYAINRVESRNGLTVSVVVSERPEHEQTITPDEALFTARVRFAVLPAFDGRAMPARAAISWTAVKLSDDVELAEASAAAIERAVGIAERSNQQPLGFDRLIAKLNRDDAQHSPPHVEVELTDDELAELHPASAREPLFLYSGASYDWNLHEPVWGLGRGTSVVHRVAQSRISVV